jgi:cytochrome c
MRYLGMRLRFILLVIFLNTVSSLIYAQLPVGDALRGERVFWVCRTCHYPEKSVGHNNGPSLWNIFNLNAGSQSGFEYSEAFKKIDFVWTPALMDIWLQDPQKFVPGNMMMSPGIKQKQDRADLIEYLKTFTDAR